MLLVIVWISPVPQLAGAAGVAGAGVEIQLAAGRRVPAAPVKSSLHTRLQPDGVGGTEALAENVAVRQTASAPVTVTAPSTLRKRFMVKPLGGGPRTVGLGRESALTQLYVR